MFTIHIRYIASNDCLWEQHKIITLMQDNRWWHFYRSEGYVGYNSSDSPTRMRHRRNCHVTLTLMLNSHRCRLYEAYSFLEHYCIPECDFRLLDENHRFEGTCCLIFRVISYPTQLPMYLPTYLSMYVFMYLNHQYNP